MERSTSKYFAVTQAALCLVASLVLVTPARRVARAAEGPRDVVSKAADTVVGILADKGLTADQKRAKIEGVADEYFDFETLSRLVLARHWKELNPEQQKQFVTEFRRHLSMTYGKNVEKYNNEKAVITGDRDEKDNDWTVNTKVVRVNAEPFIVDYRLRKRDDKWMVIDVVIEGVSLVANFRSQFQEIVTRDGPVKLIEILRDKNDKGEPLKS
ncbi:MAG TPA: ABC transporter substrate-binding protein [Candidatus Acidoferrales bacterium]|nr:ABC transporter substrate-binding protein [Candidatus Acidoferrales bacterium]